MAWTTCSTSSRGRARAPKLRAALILSLASPTVQFQLRGFPPSGHATRVAAERVVAYERPEEGSTRGDVPPFFFVADLPSDSKSSAQREAAHAELKCQAWAETAAQAQEEAETKAAEVDAAHSLLKEAQPKVEAATRAVDRLKVEEQDAKAAAEQAKLATAAAKEKVSHAAENIEEAARAEQEAAQRVVEGWSRVRDWNTLTVS